MWIALGTFLAMAVIVFAFGLLSAQKDANRRKKDEAYARTSVSAANEPSMHPRESSGTAAQGSGNRSASQDEIALVGSGQGRPS